MGAGVQSGMKGGRKLRRSGKDRSYYERQFHVTAANKMRQKARRARRAAFWKGIRAAEKAARDLTIGPATA